MTVQSKNQTTSKNTHTDRDKHIQSLNADFKNLGKLRFSQNNEALFREFRRHYFLKQDKLLLCSGVLLYACFLLGDLTLIPAPFNYYSAIFRSVIIVFLIIHLWLIYGKESTFFRNHALELFGLAYILGGSHLVIISALCPFPYDYQFLLGIVTIVSTMGIVFRLNFRVCAVSALAIGAVLTVFLFFFQPENIVKTNLSALDDILTAFPYMFSGFVIAMCVTSSYLCYFFEKQIRGQWLEKNIRVLESEKLAELTGELKLISQQDSLTSIPNRRHFFEQAEVLLTNHRRKQDTLSIIMIDVDLFKKYNDTYGHLAGDDCLKKIADTIFSSCRRSTDLIARYGGEEFILLLSNTQKKEALKIADYIRKTIYDMDIEHVKSPFNKVTISLGVTTLTCYEKLNIKDIIANADHALYQSKNNGRNTVSFYNGSDLS